MRYFSNQIKRNGYVRKNTILTKRIMLGVIGWYYIGKGWINFDWDIPKKDRQWGFMAINEHKERVLIGKTMKEAEEFCLNKYKEFYDNNPQEQDWLPDPYVRKKVKSEIIIIREENQNEKRI